MQARLIIGAIALIAGTTAPDAGLGASTPPPDPTAIVSDAALWGEGANPDVIALDEDRHSRMTVPVSIGEHGPYPFLVDTGAERTVISRELASRLSLGPGKAVVIHSMTEVQRVATALIPQLGVSQKTMFDVHAPALAAYDLGAAGMLGVDSLQNQRVMFDFARKTMSITPARKREKYWGPDAIVIRGRNLYGRLILTNAQIDGQKIVVVLDTGSQVSIGNTALRRRLAARKRLRPIVPIELTSVTGGKMSAEYTTVREIQIGGIRISDMPIGFADAHPFRQLELLDEPAFLLGMDVLRLFDRVSVDFDRKQIRFLAPNASPRMMQGRMARRSVDPERAGLAVRL